MEKISKEQESAILSTYIDAKSEYEKARDAATEAKRGLPQLEADASTARGVLKQARATALKYGVPLPKQARAAAAAQAVDAE